MEFDGRRRMRTTFDWVAQEYDRFRPQYPPEVFADLVKIARLRSGARLLEIGCGTGQATRPLAELGFVILALEPGQRLATIARQRVADYKSVDVVTSTFESWDSQGVRFDAVVSFAAFHWVDPQARHAKAASLLQRDGVLAVFDWQDVLTSDGDQFFASVVEDYAVVVPEWEATTPLPPEAIAQRVTPQMVESGCFGSVKSRTYMWSSDFSADEFVGFLSTTGSFGILARAQRMDLTDRIRRRINQQHNGSVRKQFLGELAVGCR